MDIVILTATSMWQGVTSQPLVMAAIGLMLLVFAARAYRLLRWLPLRLAPRDPQRRFGRGQRAEMLARAGGRCEQVLLFGSRCAATDELQIDHIHPHSHGGSTALRNAQVLCARHNRMKGARVPYAWSLRRLAKRRTEYFPTGVETAVVRRSVGA